MPKDLDKVNREAVDYMMGDLRNMQRRPMEKNPPPTVYGIPGLRVYEDPSLEHTKTIGYVPSEFSPIDAMFIRPSATTKTVAHETEHLLARRQLGDITEIGRLFDKMAGDKGSLLRSTFVQDANKALPYLKEKYNINPAYFSDNMLNVQSKYGRLPALAYEQLAELAAIEANSGVDLTKDPYLRKNLFKNREVREIYSALTGLRQTRLDSKDLPPHTRQKETGSGLFGDIKETLTPKRFNKGGLVDKPLPGGKKLI
jgi:hypothetical protein